MAIFIGRGRDRLPNMRKPIPRRKPDACPSPKTLWIEQKGAFGQGPERLKLREIGTVIFTSDNRLAAPAMKGGTKKDPTINDWCHKTLATGHAWEALANGWQMVWGNRP
jgi:hypothetical protein